MTKKDTYQDIPNGELAKTLAEKREALRVLRFAAAGSRPKDSNEPARLRKEIARIMTEFSTRSIKDRVSKAGASSDENNPDEVIAHTTN